MVVQFARHIESRNRESCKLCSFPQLVFNSRMRLYLPLEYLNLIMNYAYADMVIVLNVE